MSIRVSIEDKIVEWFKMDAFLTYGWEDDNHDGRAHIRKIHDVLLKHINSSPRTAGVIERDLRNIHQKEQSK